MVLREVEHEDFLIKVEGKWMLITKEILHSHPGGVAISAYKDRDATTVFHTFHAGSTRAYKMLQDVWKEQKDMTFKIQEEKVSLTFWDVTVKLFFLCLGGSPHPWTR